LFIFFLHHLPPAEEPFFAAFAAKQGSSKKPRSFSGIEAETMFAKPLICEKAHLCKFIINLPCTIR
jgi:hypothetical protein